MAEESLEPLITQCPTCRTRFRVTESQLNTAAGRVRCGACLSVFAGLEHLVLGSGQRLKPGETASEALDALLDELRADPPSEPTRPQRPGATKGRTETPVPRRQDRVRARDEALGKVVDPPAIAGRGEAPGVRVEEIDMAAPASVSKVHVDGSTPALDAMAARKARRLKLAAGNDAKRLTTPVEGVSVAATPVAEAGRPVPAMQLDMTPEDLLATPRRRRRRWWVPPAVVVGIALLTAQVLYFQFDAWTKNPDIRPIYEWLCPRLQCQLPMMRSLDEIRSKNLVVRANPDIPGQLTVDALIVNQARFAQPFPVIELRFSSVDGRPIAARRFKPEEYLDGELKGATVLASMTPVHIALGIEDPGPEAVSYYIQFR